MGFTPQAVDACSFWQLAACVDGYNKANHPNDPAPPSNAELDEFTARHERFMASKMVH
jgi:hypothetical protein